MNRVLAILWAALLVTGPVRADDAPPPDQPFPALPAASELVARNDDERAAGAAVLERVLEISGEVGWRGRVLEGEVTRKQRYRFLVLDSNGAEVFRKYGFLSDALERASGIAGRTIAPDGTIHPLDPATAVRRISLPAEPGGAAATVPSVAFPLAEPGAILDLSWKESEHTVPSLLYFLLQERLPIRTARVKVAGQLVRGRTVIVPTPIVIGWSIRHGYYWVPFFAGPVPPRSRATLNSQFDLDLELTDLRPLDGEPFRPSPFRTGCVLGLMPVEFGARKKISKADWRENLVIFGAPGAAEPQEDALTLTRELDPNQAVVRLDDLGLQEVPGDHGSGTSFLDPLQDLLKEGESEFNDDWKIDGWERTAMGSLAPADLPWKERVRRIYRHARKEIRLDPGTASHTKLSALRKDGRGSPRDLAFYAAGLLKSAGIRTRFVLALSRLDLPFHPIVGRVDPFENAWLLETGPPGETPLYLTPGDRSASFGSLPAAYAGSLAFSQPEESGSTWRLGKLPLDMWVNDTTDIDLRAAYAPDAPEVDLALRTILRGNAAGRVRGQLVPVDHASLPAAPASAQLRNDIFARWAQRWTAASWDGTPPDIDPDDAGEESLTFDLRLPWKPAVDRPPSPGQAAGSGHAVDLPAFPPAALFRNPFIEPARSQPLWLEGGRTSVRLTWSLPAGATPGDLPAPMERSGPRGLAFRMEVTAVDATATPGPAAARDIAASLTLDVPYMLPASDYPAVRTFFEELERAAKTTLPITLQSPPSSGLPPPAAARAETRPPSSRPLARR